MEDQEYANPFTDVHEKAKAFRDRVREANRNETQLRERRLVQEVMESLGKDLAPRANISTLTPWS